MRDLAAPARTVTAVLAATLIASVAALPPAASSAATRLVLPSPGLIGFHAGRSGPGRARADLGNGLRRPLRRLIAGAGAQSSQQSGGGQTVRSDALSFGSAGAAAHVLSAWRRAHHAHPVAIGRGGAVATQRSRRQLVVEVAWREGADVGVLVLRTRGAVAAAKAAAIRDARLADASLRAPAPRTALQKALAEIGPDGSISKQTALNLFALTYGSIPGAHPPRGARTTISGTLAANAILRFRSRLTRRQRAIVDSRLGLAANGSRARAASFGDPGFTENAAIEAQAGGYAALYQAKLGYTLPLHIVAGNTTTSIPGVDADAIPLNASGGNGSGTKTTCRVRVTPVGQSASTQVQGVDLAHEVFHCFEYGLVGLTNWLVPPDWITEGMAVWASLTIDPQPYSIAGGVAGGALPLYINTPLNYLFGRSYDAVGFWGHAQDVTGNLWPRIPAILTAIDNAAAFDDAAGSTDPFLSTWGSSVVRKVGGLGGFAWHMFSPVVPPDSDVIPAHVAGVITGTGNFAAAPYTTSQWVINAAGGAPLEHFVMQGHGRLSPTNNYTDLDGSYFCTSTKPCECPKDTDGTVPFNRPLPPHSALGLSGDPGDGSFGYVDALPLSAFCTPKKNNNPGSPAGGGPLQCLNGCAVVQGDPHFVTFDGAPYDFQAAGEFTAVRSTSDSLQVQLRLQPVTTVYHEGRATIPISVVTAVAVRDGRATVEFDHPLGALIVRLGKRRITLRRGHRRALAGGGELAAVATALGTGYAVVWPDGSQLRVRRAGLDALSFVMQPSAARIGKLTGLLGNFDRNAEDDFSTRSGKTFKPNAFADNPTALAAPLPFATMYGSFGNSWRITQRQSLFYYARGQSTRKFTIRGFPRRLVTLSSLSTSRRRKATAACTRRHVHNLVLLNNCEFDVAATNNTSFATGAAVLEQLAPTVGSTLPRPPSTGSHVAPWVQLSTAADTLGSPVPTIASTGSGFVSAFAISSAGDIQAASFTAATGGIGGVSKTEPVNGWSSVGDPVLLPAAGGGLQLLFDGIRTTNPSDPLDGTIIDQRNPDGTFATPTLASTMFGGLGTEAVLASDGSTPLFPSAQSGALAVNVGSSGASQVDLSSYAPGGASDPALAYDSSGRLWLAWYSDGATPSGAGLYMLQLSAADGTPVGSAVQVPQSSSADGGQRLALACAASCRLIYLDSTGTRLLSWAPGDASPAVAVASSDMLHNPAAAYASDGRLWVVWVDGDDLDARLGDALGQGGNGAIADLGTPAGETTPAESVAATEGTTLVLSATWGSSAGGARVWATTAPAP